jgi:hypothetical protein
MKAHRPSESKYRVAVIISAPSFNGAQLDKQGISGDVRPQVGFIAAVDR